MDIMSPKLTRQATHRQRLWPLVFFAGLALFVYRAAILVSSTFGEIGVEQIVYHLSSPAVGVPTRLIRETLRELVVKPITLMVLTYLLLFAVTRTVAPVLGGLKRFVYGGAWTVMALGAYNLYTVTGIGDYIHDRNTHFDKNFDWFESYYRKPIVAMGGNNRKLNLVWVYVESLEARRTKVDEFRRAIIYKTNNIQKFENLPGTGWTMGGMVASQCGLPLMPVGLLGNNGLGDADHFLPKIQCLGDILNQQGYATEFLGGADSTFAGKNKFLHTHGFNVVTGRQEIHDTTSLDFPPDFWGYTDVDVLNLAFHKAVVLHKTGQPFFLNVLTLDTHGPNGYLSAYCKQQGWANNIDGIFDCAMSQVDHFVDKLQMNGVMNNTVVVVSGDHPFMGANPGGLFSHQPKLDRSVFFSVLRTDGKVLNVPVMNHFDMFPTVLSALNFELKDQQAGMGRNLYARKSLSDTEPPGVLAKALRQPSQQYLDAWLP